MSSYGINVPSPDEINYHEAIQEQRVAAARKLIDVGDVIATVEDRLSQIADPRQHPLFELANFSLDRQSAVDGGAFYDHWRRLILEAIDSLTDDALECLGED
jgi:hypothetical protein